MASQVALVVKNPPANAGDRRDMGLVPGSGKSPGGGHGNPLQYSCLENRTDGGASWAELRSTESQRVAHDKSALAHWHIHIHRAKDASSRLGS